MSILRVKLMCLILISGIGLWLVNGVKAELKGVERAESDYRFQLNEYQLTDNDYRLRLTQYSNLQTFATQEQLVTAAKSMLIARAMTWQTYLAVLELMLADRTDALGTDKQNALESLRTWQALVSNHNKLIEPIIDKTLLLYEAQTLNEKSSELIGLSYQSLALVRVGQLIEVVEAQEKLLTEIEEVLPSQIIDEIIASTRQRGLSQIRLRLEAVSGRLNALTVQSRELKRESYDPVRRYQDLLKDTAVEHRELMQTRKLLQELSVGIEL